MTTGPHHLTDDLSAVRGVALGVVLGIVMWVGIGLLMATVARCS